MLEIWAIVVVARVSLQLFMLSRFGQNAAFDNDRLILQRSEFRSLKQKEILMCGQVSIKPWVQFITA